MPAFFRNALPLNSYLTRTDLTVGLVDFGSNSIPAS